MTKRVIFKQAWDGSNTDCLNCSLRSSALFHGLTEEDFKSMHETVEQISLEPGAVLYQEGEEGRFIFTIRSGLIKLVQHLPDGSQRIVRLLHSADVLGLEMLATDTYEHEAVVLRASELCRYPGTAVFELSQRNPVLHKDLMKRWHQALREADAWLSKLSSGSAKKRMANLLITLVEKDGSSECHLFSREDIGSILSVTIETASRTISDFKRAGLMTEISYNHYKIDIQSLQALTAS